MSTSTTVVVVTEVVKPFTAAASAASHAASAAGHAASHAAAAAAPAASHAAAAMMEKAPNPVEPRPSSAGLQAAARSGCLQVAKGTRSKVTKCTSYKVTRR